MGKRKRLKKLFLLAYRPGDLSGLLNQDQHCSLTATRKAAAVIMAALISQAISIFLALYQVLHTHFLISSLQQPCGLDDNPMKITNLHNNSRKNLRRNKIHRK